MSIFKKLQAARMKLQATSLKKSGHNKFSGYYYFELGDFLPTIQQICADMGLCGTVSFTATDAFLSIYDVDSPDQFVTFTSPMSSAALKGCHDVQNLGAVQTYLRRYLWVNAFEIVEHDALDAVTGAESPAKPAYKAPAKPAEKPAIAEAPKVLAGKPGEWQLKVEEGGDWSGAVKAATDVCLQVASTPEDVQNIFKNNRSIYDKLKEEHKPVYDEIMTLFKSTKEALTKE